jgi:hypothetical protein
VDFTVTDVEEPLPDMPPPALPIKPLLPNSSTACPKSRSNPNNGMHLTASLNREGNSRAHNEHQRNSQLRPDLPDWRHRTLFFRDPEDNVVEIYAEY